MNTDSICYLDNAATSFPKPAGVLFETQRCIKEYCGNPGRSGHRLSLLASEKIYEAREKICSLIGSDSPEGIVFTPNTTYGLNMVIKGLIKQNDHVLISDMEHNSVYRPVFKLASEGKITFDIFPALSLAKQGIHTPESICNEIKKRIKPSTRLLVCNHTSNICSFSLPVCEIGRLCKENNIIFVLDCAQSAGHIDLNIKKMNIDFLCAPGHKGLYGIQGSGFVAINNESILDTLTEGGNGIESLKGTMPDFSPERYESGTPATPCIAGLCEGIEELMKIGLPTVREHENALFSALCENLQSISGIKIYLPEHKGSTLLFNIKEYPSDYVARELSKENICVRGGYHCSALGHTYLGTLKHGGVRASFGLFNTKADIDRLSTACKKIANNSFV